MISRIFAPSFPFISWIKMMFWLFHEFFLLFFFRDLIIQSNKLTEVEDQMTSPQRLVPQIQPSTQLENSNFPRKLQYDNEDGPKVIPWWERIMSNRHWTKYKNSPMVSILCHKSCFKNPGKNCSNFDFTSFFPNF